MIVVLNGPLGIGKSTLAEVLSEGLDGCVMLDGDSLVAANPPAADEVEHLHSTLELLVRHHRGFGYRHFVVDHLWTTTEALADLRRRLTPIDPEIFCFLLTLPADENLRRIARLAAAREIDERDFELRTVTEERAILFGGDGSGLGERFDVSAPPAELVERMLSRLEQLRASFQDP